MSSKRIGMILKKPFPPDVRVEKEAKALAAAGFEVGVLAAAGSSVQQREQWEGVEVFRAHLVKGNARERAAQAITLRSAAWGRAIDEFVRCFAPTVLHAHDLPAAWDALGVAPGGCKLVADFHENYPAAVREWGRDTASFRSVGQKLRSSYVRWNNRERVVCRSADHIIAVVEEMKQRLVCQHGVLPGDVTVVTNTEWKTFASSASADATEIQCPGGFILLYIGGFGPHRGLGTAIRAMSHIRHDADDVRLLLVGKGTASEEARLRAVASEEGVTDVVEFVPWQPFSRVASYMRRANVGLIPHQSNEHTDNTIPHKLFQYMEVGLPVLVSSSAAIARTVEGIGSGLVFRASDAADMARQILQLYRSEQLRQELAERGVDATLNGVWNWETTSEKLIDIYRSLLAS